MPRMLASFTAGLVCLHALLGCCWLHAQRCALCPAEACQVAEHDGCCSHDRSERPGGHESDDPCQCRIECQGVCVYLPPEKAQIDCSDLTISFAICATPAWLDGSHMDGLPGRPRGGWADSVPPLRLHLLHQVLLI
jgi:hypothetical protein